MDIDANIKHTGLSIMGVMAGEDSPSFGYTVGLTETCGAPELLMFGLPVRFYGVLMNDIADMLKQGKVFKDGDIIDDIANMPCVIKDVPAAAVTEYACATIARYRDTTLTPRFQMVVLPDRNGKFPWDAEYEDFMKRIQPELWNHGT